MEHSLLHSYDSGFHHSAKFVGCCVSERYATAFLFLPSCSRVRPCCATAVTAAWAKRCSEALRHFRPHGPQRRWTTTALQSVLTSGFLVSAFWLKIVGSCVSEAVAHEHDTLNIIRCSPIGFSGSRCIAPSVLGWTWTFQHGTTTLLWTKKSGLRPAFVCVCTWLAWQPIAVCACWCAAPLLA